MHYAITAARQPIPWEALPVLKVTHFPFPEKYDPFTMARICSADGELFARLCSFEVEPAPESEIVLTLAHGGQALQFTLTPDLAVRAEKVDLATGRREAARAEFGVAPFGGEDNIGNFWGAEIALSQRFLRRELGLRRIANGIELAGNLVKAQDGPGDLFHFGSAAPYTAGAPDARDTAVIPFVLEALTKKPL